MSIKEKLQAALATKVRAYTLTVVNAQNVREIAHEKGKY